MEERKQKEIKYYNEQAAHEVNKQENYSPALGSHRFLYQATASLITGKKVLDYGCGEGIHIPFLAQHAKEVAGIDLSAGALAFAKKHAGRTGNVTLRKMDCEALEFPGQSFDVVFDGGTFSSLDFEKAIGEITRVLKPNGVLVGIETFGHNPLANAKRALNRLTGKRTLWAASHIVRQKELELLKQRFERCEVFYFHLVSLFAFPLLSLPGGRFVLQLAEQADLALLRIPFLRKYAFKIVFVCWNVKKDI